MLEIHVVGTELYDENKNQFYLIPDQTIELEHSLLSISKWESKWKKPFLEEKNMTPEESADYIRCMTVNENVDPMAYYLISREDFERINEYMEDTHTATTFSNMQNSKASKQIITSEIVYYWMFSLNIPKECERWHFNRLITLIEIFGIKNQPQKKMSKREIMQSNKALNEARKKRLHTKG